MNTELEALRSRNPGVEILPRGTGDALPDGPKGILKKRNKWFVNTLRKRRRPSSASPSRN